MQIHDLKRVHKNKTDRIVGRGGKHAKTSGRGTKGQSSRAGNKKRPELRDIIKKLPKLRGYRTNSYEIKPAHISLDMIVKVFPQGGLITPAILVEKKAVKKFKGFTPKVKILGGKEKFGIKIQVSKCKVSSTAKEMIEKAGGEVTI
ncbi:MAG: uL15 family ribosomal protein [Candidatus Nomurabacteria bacterium]|nr:uL15 family ribosomal protein [Candidatus Nomurabacteria bacterium]